VGGNEFSAISSVPIMKTDWMQVLFTLFRICALYTTASAVISSIGAEALKRLRLWATRRSRLCLIYGVSDDTAAFGTDLLSKKAGAVVYVSAAAPASAASSIDRAGCLLRSDSHALNPDKKFLKSLHDDSWFYVNGEVLSIKPLSKLEKIYNGSVGGNASMLVGIASQPDRLIGEKDVEALVTFGAVLSIHFEDNLALESSMQGNRKLDDLHAPARALPDKEGFWHSGDNPEGAELILDMGDEYDVDRVVLSENIRTGQQIEKFALYVEKEGKWKKVETGTVIGRKHICELDLSIRTRRVKLVILKTRKFATIKEFSVY
jgi:hypothetical protein